MRKLTVFLLLAGISDLLIGQVNYGVKFNKVVHHFGNVKEESETVSTVFSFTNISDKPVFITKVETSCGCTKPQYTLDTIQPGDTGFVKAIYETRGRQGEFHKNLYVHFNIINFYQSLIISGYVVPEANLANKPKEYTTTYSNLAFNTTLAEFHNLYNTQKQTFRFKAYNYMGYPIRFYEVSQKPDYVTVDLEDSLINPNDSIVITIEVDGKQIKEYGETTRRIELMTDDPGGLTKYLHVFTHLKEDFSHYSKKQMKAAPVVNLDQDNPVNLGKFTAGGKYKHLIKVSNNGKSPLTIYSVTPLCTCIKARMAKYTIAPGETVLLELTLDTINLATASHSKYLTLICNDPARPEIKIKTVFDITQ